MTTTTTTTTTFECNHKILVKIKISKIFGSFYFGCCSDLLTNNLIFFFIAHHWLCCFCSVPFPPPFNPSWLPKKKKKTGKDNLLKVIGSYIFIILIHLMNNLFFRYFFYIRICFNMFNLFSGKINKNWRPAARNKQT